MLLVTFGWFGSRTHPEPKGSFAVIFGINPGAVFGGDPCSKNPHSQSSFLKNHLKKGSHHVIIRLSRKNYSRLDGGNTFNKRPSTLCAWFFLCKGFFHYILFVICFILNTSGCFRHSTFCGNIFYRHIFHQMIWSH